MPIRPRPADGHMKQEWLTDTSNGGRESGLHNLEVAFNGDDQDGQWTTHMYLKDDPERRLNRGDRTAIVITGISREREEVLNALIQAVPDEGRGTRRDRILQALSQDDHLRWES